MSSETSVLAQQFSVNQSKDANRQQQDGARSDTADAQMQEVPTGPAAMKKRPRLDLGALGLGERKRGKSMFGVLVNTLNKAKAEDKERNASEAAKKRQLIEQRLQSKLKKETDSVRRAEEAKKDKITANRKEEELQLKDSIHKLRRTRIPQLSNFLLTSDVIRDDETPDDTATGIPTPLAPRSHPPSLYYLPTILTKSQEAFLNKRKTQSKDVSEQEWETFKAERQTGIGEIAALRLKVAEEDERKRAEREKRDKVANQQMETDAPTSPPVPAPASVALKEEHEIASEDTRERRDAEMEVDDEAVKDDRDVEPDKKEEPRAEGDEDDAVEY